MTKPLSLLMIILMSVTPCLATPDVSVSQDVVEHRNSVGVSYEYSQFQLSEGSITGYGLRTTFQHAIKESWALEVSLSAALNGQGSVQNSFTGFSGFGYYSLMGKAYDASRKISVAGIPVFAESSRQKHNLMVGAGLTQYFLNGNRGVYSSSGVGLGVLYKIDFSGWDLRFSGRYHMMRASQFDVQTMNFDVGIVFSL